MSTYKMIVAYDGTDFFGWQVQPKAVSVAGTLEKTFTKIFDQPISLLGASRTDTGVHAAGQVARFHANLNVSDEQLLFAWNNLLPRSIRIRSLQKVADSFNPRSNVVQKVYYYHLFTKPPLPFVARYGWYPDYAHLIRWDVFADCLQLYVGTHDFASFCKQEGDEKTVRTIDSIHIEKISRLGMVRVVVKGRAFLRFQIRRMIGYAIDVARRAELSPAHISSMLEHPNSQQTLLKAEGCGLMLRKIIYTRK